VSPSLTISNNAVVDIAIDGSGNKWLATDGSGVVVLDSTNTGLTIPNPKIVRGRPKPVEMVDRV
jgi:hypothetical protein